MESTSRLLEDFKTDPNLSERSRHFKLNFIEAYLLRCKIYGTVILKIAKQN